MNKLFQKNHLPLFAFGVLFLCHVFFLSYQLAARSPFGWDQVDNAWIAKNMIVNHQFPLLGMQARQGTGIYMGPFYYYFITAFYFLFNLDPIASPIAALVTGLFTFFAIVYVSAKLFGLKASFLITLLYTFSMAAIQADKVQWPVAFIPLISTCMFYALYNLIQKKENYVLLVAFLVGFSFHIHFTSVFYIPILILCIPFYPRTKKFIVYSLVGVVTFLLWMSPVIAGALLDKAGHVNNFFAFANSSSNGLHLRRVIQIAQLPFIEFSNLLRLPFSQYYVYAFPIIFSLVYYFAKKTTERLKFLYLFWLWILIPWLFLATYKGELSDYFFTFIRPVALFSMGYLLFYLLSNKQILAKLIACVFILFFLFLNIQLYFTTNYQGLAFYENREYASYKKGEGNVFLYGAPESYLFYFYHRNYDKK